MNWMDMDASRWKMQNAQMDWMDAKHKTVHGLHQCSPRVRLPAGQSLQNTLILAHMEMDGHRGKRKKGSRHGVMAEAGKRGMARQGRNRPL